jgi:glycosyltransferase involved in cell wall biosynthesis
MLLKYKRNPTESRVELISIIVPTYNQAEYLPICLDSIWFQDWDNLEIIVVNDGSTDNTSDVIEDYRLNLINNQVSFASNYNEATLNVERTYKQRYQQEGRSLVVIDHKKNKGLSEALNTGFMASKGELCTFIASDDMLLPQMITELATAIQSSSADFAYADMHIVDDKGRILRKFSMPDYSFQACFCNWYFCGVAKLYRRALHDAFGYYDASYTVQDHEMYLRFATGGAKFIHVPMVLVNARVHANDREVNNHSAEGMSRLYRESSQLVVKARDFLKNSKIDVREDEYIL